MGKIRYSNGEREKRVDPKRLNKGKRKNRDDEIEYEFIPPELRRPRTY